MRKYCADLVGLLGDAEIVLLEIKELDCSRGVLPAFDEQQHDAYLRLEQIGVPIAYAYNDQEKLAYHERPRLGDWPIRTLNAVKRAVPSALPHAFPHVPQHGTLLDWLQAAQGRNAVDLFGRVHGAIDAASDLRNGVLVLLYGVSQQTLATLTPQQVLKVLQCLDSSWLKPSQQQKLASILGASAQVFSDFTSPPPARLRPPRP